MSTSRSWRATGLAALASVGLLVALAGPVAAAEPVPAWEYTFTGAEQACAGFDLHVAGYGEGSQVVREFDGRGGTALSLVAGTGWALAFTNATSGATFTTTSSGAATWTAAGQDGTSRKTMLGHNAVLLFPADNGGPSTILYIGRVTVDVSAAGVWTVTKNAGTALDICAALS
jgi:hypothetical protein